MGRDFLKKLYILFLLSLVLLSSSAYGSVKDKADDAIKDYILNEEPKWIGEDIKISYENNSFKDFGDDIDFKVSENYRLTKMTPKILIPLVVYKDGTAVKTINLWTKIEIFKNVVVPSKNIPKNAIISEDDLILKKKDVSLLQPRYFDDIGNVAGKVAKNKIYSGYPVYDWMIKDNPVVSKGDRVLIKVSGDNIFIESYGIALEDGQIGDKIKVRRADSKVQLDAYIINSKEVEVRL